MQLVYNVVNSCCTAKWFGCCCCSAAQQLLLFVSDCLWPHGLQHARLPCPSLSLRVCSDPCPLSQWCHPTISPSVAPFFTFPQSFSASGSFPMIWLFASGSQSIGASHAFFSPDIYICIYIYLHSFLKYSFPLCLIVGYWIYNFLCYSVGPCCLSIRYIIAYIC